MTDTRAVRLPAVAIVAALALGGCGGSSHPAAKSQRSGLPISAPLRSALEPGLLGGAGTAGASQSYVPTGRILADSGFRPQINGFGFENYGNDAGPVNLTPQNVEDLFGAGVCASGEGAGCRLIPQARFWMDRVNTSMANGHCMGFSVTALRVFSGNLSLSSLGGTRTIALPVRNDNALQSLIAEGFAYQDLPAVTGRAVQGSPDAVLGTLIAALRAGREQYTLAILKSDGTGGHAITPFAVEDRGGGQAEILVYDNNFPGVVRKLDVDTRADTWHYVGGINPSDTSEVYAGDARTKSMLLLPTTPGERQQPCPFCAAGGANPGRPSVIDKLHYIEVGLSARGTDHPHLLLIDPQGRRTGYLGGRLVNEIPGVQVVQDFSVQNWHAAPEPTYHLPLGHPDYRVILDSSSLHSPTTAQLQVNGAGVVFYVKDIHVYPGQQDAFALPSGDLAFAFVPGGRFPATPLIAAQFPQTVPGTHQVRLITLATGAVGFAPGSQITLAIRPSTGTAEVSGAGDRPLVRSARFALSMDSSPVSGGVPERSYSTVALPLNGTSSQIAEFQYLTPMTTRLPVRILGPSGTRTFSVPPH